MKYIDNLIAWADQLFRQDTMESINEATQLYIFVAEILGPRPVEILPSATVPVKTYDELEPRLDHFSNALVRLENYLPVSPGSGRIGEHQPLPDNLLYFCVPNNPELLARWDTVEDRLFKIRHSMNIEGVARQLALFEPPINPALLVKAAAAGLDIGSVLADLNAPLPHYRFGTLLQRALDLCAHTQALGNALLSALEKRDAEALAAIRATQEAEIHNQIKLVKEAQITEAQGTIDALNKTKALASARKRHYDALLSQDTKVNVAGFDIPLGGPLNVLESIDPQLSQATKLNVPGLDLPLGVPLNVWESAMLELGVYAAGTYTAGAALEIAAGVEHALPDEGAGTCGQGGYAGEHWGGSHGGHATAAAARAFKDASTVLDLLARLTDKMASFVRRQEEWQFQSDQAGLEELQVQAQIDAATLHKTTMELERDLNEKQKADAEYVRDYMQDKFTNTDLYGWMTGQVAGVYFQSYQLAYDTAKRAERAYRFELGLEDSNFIQFGYWDNLKKGLLAGERLALDLKRLEASYLEKNKRDYEITKHLSLLMLDPQKLLVLRETGACEFDIPELAFDLDTFGRSRTRRIE